MVTNFTANVLLAAGAAPAMVDIVGEAGPFAGVASGVLVNLGTLPSGQPDAMVEAATAAAAAGTPWVLDPVAVGALPVRTALAARLVGAAADVVRGNASEIIAVAGLGGGGRGRGRDRRRGGRRGRGDRPGRAHRWGGGGVGPGGPGRRRAAGRSGWPTATRC